jgi:membrane-bound lytic murein transglycosylase D
MTMTHPETHPERTAATLAAVLCACGLLAAGCGSRTITPETPSASAPAPAPFPRADREPPPTIAEAPPPAPVDQPLVLRHPDPPEARAETVDTVTEDLLTAVHDIAIPLNPRVLGFVELFGDRLRPSLESGLGRGAPYLPMIQAIFREQGLPLDLAYIPLIESAFRTDAVSRASARGMWQFMRGTAVEQGLRYDWYVDERSDPEKATRAAAQYLKTLYERFENWHLALAAYNAGPGRVQRALTRSGQETFWDIASSSRYLPRETRDYVPLVLAAIVVARNPDRYGLEIVPDEPVIHETVTLDHAVDLRRVAEWTGASTEAIQALNPELRRWTTPLDTEGYVLKVPMGTADPLLTRLASLGPEDLIPTADYVVVSGDTLSGVAARLKVSRYDLADANYLPREAHLRIGQRLIVPRAPALARAGTEAAPAQVAPAAPSTVDGGFLTHRVNRGDTLYEIARRYRTTVSLIKEWNQLSSNLIRIGQVLTIGTR